PSIGSLYLGPSHAGVPLSLDPANPLPFGRRPAGVLSEEQRNEFELVGKLDALAAVEYPEDETLRSRIRAFELAYRMQRALPEALDLSKESAETHKLYGLDRKETEHAGRVFLSARRMAERGVRFVQAYPSAYGSWDSHQKLRENHT